MKKYLWIRKDENFETAMEAHEFLGYMSVLSVQHVWLYLDRENV